MAPFISAKKYPRWHISWTFLPCGASMMYSMPPFSCHTKKTPFTAPISKEYEVEHLINHRHQGRSRQLQYFVKWKGYPESNSTWELAQNIHAPDLLRKYHQHYPLQDKKGKGTKEKTSSQARMTTTCLPTLQTNLPPILPTNCLSLLLPTIVLRQLKLMCSQKMAITNAINFVKS